MVFAATALLALSGAQATAQQGDMSFFITSTGAGQGANLGGLAGADAHCQMLAEAAGAGAKTWRAYLSTQETAEAPAINARDRIGSGPWQNAAGVVIATDVEALHGENNLTKETALTETGAMVNGRGDEPSQHDILTGTQADGTAFPAGEDMTCGNWTLGGTEGSAMMGHHDRMGPETLPTGTSWNAAHASRGGCSQEALIGTGGAGLLYCFAAD
jgi:hypothetical protein